MAYALKGFLLDLPDSFSSNAQFSSDLLKCAGLVSEQAEAKS